MELSKLIRAPEVNPKAVELLKGNSELIFFKVRERGWFSKKLKSIQKSRWKNYNTVIKSFEEHSGLSLTGLKIVSFRIVNKNTLTET